MSLRTSNYKPRGSSNKFKSLSIRSIDNTSVLKSFMIKPDKNNFNITIVPNRTYLYQGTDFDFEANDNDIKKYFKYYNKRHNGAYFLSSSKIASIYGTSKDFTNIIYTTIPNIENVNKSSLNMYEYVYPLYYIPGIRGSDIKYKIKKDMYLLNIGDITNIKKLWEIIENSSVDDETKELYQDIMYDTCAEYNKSNNIPTKCKRSSNTIHDDDLVELFKELFIPKIRELYNVKIDGWIYYKTKSNFFHDEILIMSNDYLEVIDIAKMKKTKYDNIPTIDEYKKTMNSKKVLNKNINYHTILNNFCNIPSFTKSK